MRTYLLLLAVCCCFTSLLTAQSATYHRAKVLLDGRSINELAALGLEVDHGTYAPYRHLINDFSADELQQIIEAGFEYEILIEDVVDFYQDPARQAASEFQGRGGYPCTDNGNGGMAANYVDPTNFHLGSMGGHFTYSEMLEILDSMRLLYP
ncbi:MAG: hypothetical protein AAGA62_19950, partial [Bacteroidota bacterium]